MKFWTIIALLGSCVNALQLAASDSNGYDDVFDALSSFGVSEAPGSREPLLGVAGFYGQPQPQQWLILTSIKEKSGVLRESVASEGKVVAERQFRRLSGQDLPDIPIARRSLKISSLEAFKIGKAEAKRHQVSFESVHFQLSCCDQAGEPVWMLSFIDRAQASVGSVYLSAVSGNVIKTVWQDAVNYTTFLQKKVPASAGSDAFKTAGR
ncbi:MAG: hypothetical protein CMO61_10105 [Verrucomicrobiales bacterium]|nr:hypothetical protein [Verrucomicrobiales bacterium]|tara:strand:- start:42379 stop:43005 length:627 start_codon:yes stop_codon:yes gene_type:complete